MQNPRLSFIFCRTDAATLAAAKAVAVPAMESKVAADEPASEEQPVEAAEPVMSKEDKAAAARERFLVRKRKAPS
jgi:hypothetical protein